MPFITIFYFSFHLPFIEIWVIFLAHLPTPVTALLKSFQWIPIVQLYSSSFRLEFYADHNQLLSTFPAPPPIFVTWKQITLKKKNNHHFLHRLYIFLWIWFCSFWFHVPLFNWKNYFHHVSFKTFFSHVLPPIWKLSMLLSSSTEFLLYFSLLLSTLVITFTQLSKYLVSFLTMNYLRGWVVSYFIYSLVIKNI